MVRRMSGRDHPNIVKQHGYLFNQGTAEDRPRFVNTIRFLLWNLKSTTVTEIRSFDAPKHSWKFRTAQKSHKSVPWNWNDFIWIKAQIFLENYRRKCGVGPLYMEYVPGGSIASVLKQFGLLHTGRLRDGSVRIFAPGNDFSRLRIKNISYFFIKRCRSGIYLLHFELFYIKSKIFYICRDFFMFWLEWANTEK